MLALKKPDSQTASVWAIKGQGFIEILFTEKFQAFLFQDTGGT